MTLKNKELFLFVDFYICNYYKVFFLNARREKSKWIFRKIFDLLQHLINFKFSYVITLRKRIVWIANLQLFLLLKTIRYVR